MTSGTAARDQGPGTGAAPRSAGTLVFVSSDGPVAEVMAYYRNVIRAARDSAVARVVALSGLDADPPRRSATRSATGTPGRLLAEGGCPVSIARASIYSDFFLGLLARSRTSGQLRLPAADGRISLVCRADVARCLAPLVVAPASGRHHDITGPESPALATLQPRRRASRAPRWSTPASRPPSIGQRWLSPLRTPGGYTRTRRCSRRSGDNAGRQPPMKSTA
jgi:NAD(P)H dehydrogenase (quinone)